MQVQLNTPNTELLHSHKPAWGTCQLRRARTRVSQQLEPGQQLCIIQSLKVSCIANAAAMMLAAPHMPERFLPMAGFALQHTEVVLCPRSMIGRVIGKNGETIKALQA